MKFTLNVFAPVGGFSNTKSFVAGTYNIRHVTTFSSVTMQTYEIKEKGGTPPVTDTDGDFFLMM